MKDSEAMCHWKRAAQKNNYTVVYRLQHPTVSFGNLKLKWTIYCTRQCCARVQVLNDISHVFQIFSRVIMSNGLNQPLPQEGFELDDQFLKALKWPWGLTANVATIAGRIRHIHLLRVPLSTTVPSSMPYFLMTLRSWSMSNSSVASLPADMGRKPRNRQPENRKPKSRKADESDSNAISPDSTCKHHNGFLSTGVLTLRTQGNVATQGFL